MVYFQDIHLRFHFQFKALTMPAPGKNGNFADSVHGTSTEPHFPLFSRFLSKTFSGISR